MSTLYVTEPHSLVKKDGETLVVVIPEDKAKGTEKRQVRVPLIKIDQVVVYGDSTLTSPALAALLDQHVEVCFLSHYGKYRGRLSPAFSKNSLIRIEQHRAHDDAARSLPLARAFVAGKLSNMRTLLLRANRKLNDAEIVRGVASLKAILDRVERTTCLGTPLEEEYAEMVGRPGPLETTSINALDPKSGDLSGLQEPTGLPSDPKGSLIGMEGAGSAAYFGLFGRLLKQDLGFRVRSKRPPTDPVNALLSYGYVLLMHQVASAINLVGLDPYVGYLHSSQYGKPALALDLMEEFRPVVVDSVVLTLVNNRILTEGDFVAEFGAYRLSEAGRRTFLTKYEERLSTLIEHPTFDYKATYRKCIELQVRLLAKALTGEIPEYVPLVVR